jgi:hypothetical protein
MTNDKDSAVLEVTTIVGHAKQLLDYASADCSECGGSGASFGHGLAVEVEHIVDRLADLALRQPTQTDALKIARERITEWCDAVVVEWGQGSQTHNVARDGRDIVLAALRQPQTDALKIAREALEAAPLIGATESAESFKARQDAWLNGQYRAALDQSK